MSLSINDISPDQEYDTAFLPTRRKATLPPLQTLTERHKAIISGLVFGLESDGKDSRKARPATIEELAAVYRCRRRHIRWLLTDPLFKSAFSAVLAAKRLGMGPKALAAIDDCLDDANPRIRLDAAKAALGDDKAGSAITIANQVTVGRIGYHIAPCDRPE